jgi:Holliday junction DNA helicase RuvB
MSHPAHVPASADPAVAVLLPTASPAAAEAAGSGAPCALDLMQHLGMRPGLASDDVQRRLARASRHEESGRRVLAFYLVEMEQRRLYQGTGQGSTLHYAEARLALDRRRTAELIRVGTKLLELGETDRAFCEGRLAWASLLIVARMAVPEHEAAWLREALRLDVRTLALLASRSKVGGPPRIDGEQKGLPEIRFPVHAKVSPLTFAKIEQAQRMLGAEMGRAVDLSELLDVLAGEFLSTEADGTVKGRKRVDSSLFRVHLVESDERGGPLLVETEEGQVPVDAGGPGKGGALSEALRCDAGVRTHHAHGAHGAGGRDLRRDTRARDVKTPKGMRERVLSRDRHRCQSCRSRRDLMAHHVEFRSHGGRTVAQNLITVCSRCHGLVHADLLILRGEHAESVVFVDTQGCPVSGPDAVSQLEVASIRLVPPVVVSDAVPPAPRDVRLDDVPREVDPTWWRQHAHLIKRNGEHGDLRFQAGQPVEMPEPPPPPVPPVEQAFAGSHGTLVRQEERIARLARAVEGAKARGTALPHVLLTGPAGTGKTSLARGIATLAQRPLVEVSATLVSDRAAWVRLLAGLPQRSVLFLDEVHALSPALQDTLLEALTDGKLSLVLCDGPTSRPVTLRLPTFTLVAATTHAGGLTAALRSRFGLREALTHYDEEALAQVVTRIAAAQKVEVTPDGALRLAQAARGAPREVIRLYERTLDELAAARAGAQAASGGTRRIDAAAVAQTLENLGHDAEGLDPGEQAYMDVLRESALPVPLARLALALGTTEETVTKCLEPWLIRRGFVDVTSGGRVAARGPSTRGRGRTALRDGWGFYAFAGAPNVRRWRTVAPSAS